MINPAHHAEKYEKSNAYKFVSIEIWLQRKKEKKVLMGLLLGFGLGLLGFDSFEVCFYVVGLGFYIGF